MRVRAVQRDKSGELRTADWIDRTRAPFAEGDIIWVPVIASESCDREIPERKRYRGRGYYRVGDIAVLHGKEPTRSEIDEIAGFCHPRGILWIKSLQDITRTPETKIVWGCGGEVCHREAGFSYILDPEKVMFSMGNREEKARIARMVRNQPRPERIADMFAGIGYFSIPLAGTGADVHAIEINPVAFGYLVRTIEANGLSGRITPSFGDSRCLLSGTYDENEVWVNADVARRLGLASGQYVRLRNQDGVVSNRILVKATERIRPDCVYMVHGFGHSAKRLTRALGKGASDAQLMTRSATDPLMGGTGMNVNFVTIEAEA